MAEYIYEFLYRGRAPGDPTPVAYHLILRDPDTGRERTLNMQQAFDEGWSLPDILNSLNSATLIERDSLQHRVSSIQVEAETQAGKIKELEQALEAEKTKVSE